MINFYLLWYGEHNLATLISSLENIFVGVSITLIVSLVVFLVKKIIDILNKVTEIHGNQTEFRKDIKEIVEKQKSDAKNFSELSLAFVKHMEEEVVVVERILSAIEEFNNKLDAQSLAVAIAAFKQAAFYSHEAFYISLADDDGWEFMWGNDSYFKMSGLTLAEAKAEAYWEKNIPKENLNVFRKTLIEQANRGEDIDIVHDYIFSDGSIKKVRLSATPVLTTNGRSAAYFGAIKVIEPRSGLGKGPNHRS